MELLAEWTSDTGMRDVCTDAKHGGPAVHTWCSDSLHYKKIKNKDEESKFLYVGHLLFDQNEKVMTFT